MTRHHVLAAFFLTAALCAPALAQGQPQPQQDQPAPPQQAPADQAAPPQQAPTPPAPAAAPPTAAPETPALPAPSQEQLEALRVMEEEVGAFTERATEYRARVDGIVKREYRRRRLRLDETYETQIAEEERLQQQARLDAIRYFEEFLRRYPADTTYTPDAIFRLAELYFEQSYTEYLAATDVFQAEVARVEAAGGTAPPEPPKDYSKTIELYRRLIAEWPNYRHIDGAYYLLGYCLNETAHEEEARLAWLAMVCHNHFQYQQPTEAQPGSDEPGQPPPDEPEHPSQTLGQEDGEPAVEEVFVDPFAGCEPVVPDSTFIAETWLRVGEYHFEYDYSTHGLDLAISAYRKVLPLTNSPYYDKALYKLAWAYYRADRYPEAVQHFSLLVDYADSRREQTGRTGSELRIEAIQYLGFSFSEDDWNGDSSPDPETGIQRIQQAQLMPQDRVWTPEVYIQLGDIYLDQAKYPEAIAIYALVLRRWPLHQQAPRLQEQIATAHQRNNEFEAAIAARGQLANYGEESQWAAANVEHPEALRQASELAENALIDTAIHYHRTAQALRQRGVVETNPELLRRAQENYNLAATAYRAYITRFPNSPNAYELNYNLADALFYSDQWLAAHEEYTRVRDSNLDDRFLLDSAFAAVKALEQYTDAQIASGALQVRQAPPDPTPGTPPTVAPIPIPELLVKLNTARDAYIRRVGAQRDRENRIPGFAYQTAQVMYRYGHWDEAKARFADIFERYCTTHEGGVFSWQNLVNMAGALNQTEEAERLARMQAERRCSFAGGAAVQCGGQTCPAGQICQGERCVAAGELGSQVLTAAQFRHAMDKFAEAERTQNNTLYEQAAEMLVQAVGSTPRHPEAAKALNNAAVAYERVNRYESATRLYERIVTEYPDSDFVDNALFRTAFNYSRFFEFERAVESYRLLADSPRFRQSTHRRDAILNSAIILEGMQQYERAASYYQQFSTMAPNENEAAEAAFKAADMSFRRRAWPDAVRAYRDFLRRFGGVRGDSAAFVVKANWNIAEALRESRQNREYSRALADTIEAFRRTGAQPGTESAEYAAHARFIIVEEQLGDYERLAIRGGGAKLKQSVEAKLKRAREMETEYGTVKNFRRPEWTVAAQYRIGYLYERAAKALLEAPVPAEVTRLGPEAEDIYRGQIQENVTPMEERAVREYQVAVEAAREGAIQNEWTIQALERLNAYRPEEFPLVRPGRSTLELDQQSAPSMAPPDGS
jgi:tetratricopeptide (TPR) repeat protein